MISAFVVSFSLLERGLLTVPVGPILNSLNHRKMCIMIRDILVLELFYWVHVVTTTITFFLLYLIVYCFSK